MAITGANDKKAWQDVRTETGEVVEKLKNNLTAKWEKYLGGNW